MVIKKRDITEISIDLSGPQGNAYFLLGQADVWAKQMGLDSQKILDEMKASDYEHLVKVFDGYFGHFCTLYR